MIAGIIINKNRLSKRPIGCIAGSEADNGLTKYKNIVIGFIGQDMVLIKTNMNQSQWDRFCRAELSEEELLKFT